MIHQMPSSTLTKFGWKNWKKATKGRYFLSRGPFRLSSRNRGKNWTFYEPGANNFSIKFKAAGSPEKRFKSAQIIGNAFISNDLNIPDDMSTEKLLQWAEER